MGNLVSLCLLNDSCAIHLTFSTGPRWLRCHHRRFVLSLFTPLPHPHLLTPPSHHTGMWPYSYDTCDLGTFPNQTNPDGTTPAAALTGSTWGTELSYLPGQRTSACTCSGEDHPGPSNSRGRSAPEIDIIEAQIDVDVMRGQVSQSLQVAPFNYLYEFDNDTSVSPIYDDSITSLNSYKGGQWQQAVSALTYIDEDVYNDENYATYGVEYWSNRDNRDEGYITWYSQGTPSWKVTAGSIGADSEVEISERLIPEEPMVSGLVWGRVCED